jgi:DNA-binding GntR family transcriptional regulator
MHCFERNVTKTSAQPLISPFDGLDPISKLSLPEQVYLSLRDALMSGRFPPGQRVPLRTIAAAMGVSTMPVREAVNRLVATGALELLPNRRVSVPLISDERYRDLTRAKVLIECSVAEANFPLITEKELGELEDLHKKMRVIRAKDHSAENIQCYLSLNKRFHFTIYSLYESKALMNIIESLWIQLGPYFNLLHSESSEWRGDSNHENMIKAIKEGSSSKLKQAVREDLEGATQYIIENKFLDPA